MRGFALGSLVAVLLTVLIPPGSGETKPRNTDQLWARPGLAERRIRQIAILPAFGPAAGGGLFVEDRWLLRFFEDGHDWIAAPVSNDYLLRTSRQSKGAYERLAAQVVRAGQLDSMNAPALARALGADALLTIRRDRWERVNEAGHGMTSAYVGLTVALTDSTGALLWKVSGVERETAHFGVPSGVGAQVASTYMTEGADASNGGDASPYGSITGRLRHKSGGLQVGPVGTLPPDFRLALDRLLARWAPLFPRNPRAPR